MALVIDSNWATLKQRQYEPFVTYWLYTDDGYRIPANLAEEKNYQQQTGLCFSNFLRAATIGKSRNKTPNRIAYKPKINRFGQHLTSSEIERWIERCVEWKLLPPYMEVGHLQDKYFVLKFDDISPSLVYVYLCNLRHYEEWPDVIRISLYLADELKVDPYLAVTFAAYIGCGTSVHNYLHFDEVWTHKNPTPPNPTVSLAHAVALKWYITNPSTYDTRSCYGSGDFSAPTFTCWPTIQKIVQQLPIIKVPGCDLDHPEVVAAINSVDVVSAKKHINKYVPSQQKAAA